MVSRGRLRHRQHRHRELRRGHRLGRLHQDHLHGQLAEHGQPAGRSSAESIVSPPNGSIAANRGALAIEVDDAQGNGIPNVGVSGSGADELQRHHRDAPAASIVGDLPAGDYTLTASGVAAGLVDQDGNPPGPQPDQRDRSEHQHGRAPVRAARDRSRSTSPPGSAGSLVASKADSIMVFNTGMSTPKTFGTPGTLATTITATVAVPVQLSGRRLRRHLRGRQPEPERRRAPAGPAGGRERHRSRRAATRRPRSSSRRCSSRCEAARARSTRARWSRAPRCGSRTQLPDDPTTGFKRTFTTNSQGTLDNPGLPYSTYDVCVGNSSKHKTVTGVSVKDMTNGTTLSTFYLGTSVGTQRMGLRGVSDMRSRARLHAGRAAGGHDDLDRRAARPSWSLVDVTTRGSARVASRVDANQRARVDPSAALRRAPLDLRGARTCSRSSPRATATRATTTT